MSEEARSGIAASRALYFSELQQDSPTSPQARVKRPSYVGISTSLNGYTPYATYRTADQGRKISPPLHLPTNLPTNLHSVSLVLNQDGFQRSLLEFNETMRDLNMGRPESSDITDNGSILHVNDEFYPTSHIKQVIENGGTKSVTTITQFHSGVKRNLVSKQIERLYGPDPLAQVRLTSPEPPHSKNRHNGSLSSNGCSGTPNSDFTYSPAEVIYSPANVTSSHADRTTPERKLSGGFFSKRFGITKMKDHSTLKSPETPKEYKPLKVPAVFKLLRPEFREQLKQSSCKVSMPEEGVKERIIPIRMEYSPGRSEFTPSRFTSTPPAPEDSTSSSKTTPRSRNAPEDLSTPVSRSTQGSKSSERIIPISRLSNGEMNGIKLLNGTNGLSNGQVPATNGLGKYGLAAGRRSVPNVIGFRSPPSDRPSEIISKPLVIRKLSPLSPKHIIVPASKPAPAPKPEHLMSPPMSPVPSEETRSPALSRTGSSDGTRSPALSRTGSLASPTPPEPKDVSADIEKLNMGDSTAVEDEVVLTQEVPENPVIEGPGDVTAPVKDTVQENGDLGRPTEKEEVEDATAEEMEEVSEKDMEVGMEEYGEYDREDLQYHPQYFQCGLRERELLCPILEEDNESTASGSILNLQSNGNGYCPDDPLLLTYQGEVQDGHYFIKVLENEIFKFEEQICDFEEELSMSSDIPEECRENMLSTVGLAKLLMAQKMAQFRGLCDKNMTVSKEEDPFVPTLEDLAGFWDMVQIQVEQVHGKFESLQRLRADGWKQQVEEVKKPKARKAVNKTVNKPIKPKEKSELTKARDEARKKMMEERKKAMKNNQMESDLVIMM